MPPSTWRVLSRSVRGSSHRRDGRPNQDAFASLPLEGFGPSVVVAIADGHGSPRYMRSDLGARMAASVAAQLCEEFVQRDFQDVGQVKTQADEELGRNIVKEWRRRVDSHLKGSPLAQNELSSLDESGRKQLQEHPFVAYGSTFIAASVTQSFLLLLQLGDGDVLCVSSEGQVSRPIDKDPSLVGNETTSLGGLRRQKGGDGALSDPWRDIVSRVIPLGEGQGPALVMLSTDGYSNSFSTESAPDSFTRVAGDMFKAIREEGAEAVEDDLFEWMRETSDKGSGDDVTVALLWRPAMLAVPQNGPALGASRVAESDAPAQAGAPASDAPTTRPNE